MKRILVVEDEQAIREMIGFALKKDGLQFEEAADAEKALVAIASNPPDLVLLDWMLPGLSGVELARRLRREDVTAKLPMILLTARVEENDRVHGLEVGADDYITKPFSPRELIARINAVLRRSQAGSEERPI
jgi:two-component system phosphate regulon response regulator PhoB